MEELNLTIDHVTLSVADIERAKAFYASALEPLGMALVGDFSAEATGDVAVAGFGIGRKGTLWLAARANRRPRRISAFGRALAHACATSTEQRSRPVAPTMVSQDRDPHTTTPTMQRS